MASVETRFWRLELIVSVVGVGVVGDRTEQKRVFSKSAKKFSQSHRNQDCIKILCVIVLKFPCSTSLCTK